ncbi:saccharopine dehydrogenase-like oxidoreductase [Coccinella septempunctata]|uniref:saccharopine dehydrogenase-like oxidoreductase n=1 Tax=Coccinella septempunctata TaxID=41139 RepID=UPI001D097876|nr:saccharopine dehydrogenase-like oxidoreductase [Coccinella septempunctata]
MSEKLDLILFGVTGLVGRYGVRHLYKLSKEKNLTFGVAGRNEQKIKNVLVKLEEETGDKSIAKIPIILADMSDEQSIKQMTSRCKVLIQSCGPLRQLGEVVVKACIESRTHYVDVSAEENFIDKVALEYQEQAKKAGIYMVGSCGIDCIAYDLGVLYIQKKFRGTVNSVETYLKMDTDDPTLTGPSYNVSTWKSTIDLMLNKRELKALQARIFNKNMPKLKPALGTKHLPFKPYVEDGWSILLTGSDRSVMMRTQQYLYEEKNKRPVQVQTYYMLKALWYLIFFVIFGLMFAFLLPFKLGRKILLRYPAFFTGGVFGNEEPSQAMCENAWFRLTFVAKGWKDKIVGPDEKFNEKPNHGMMLQVKGKNPGYGGTALCLVLAGVMIATQADKLPSKPGVYTPGIAFGETTIVEDLHERGLSFDVLNEFAISS